MAVMQETIEHGGNGGAIAEQFAPVVYWSVRSQQAAGALIAPHYDFQQVLCGVRDIEVKIKPPGVPPNSPQSDR